MIDKSSPLGAHFTMEFHKGVVERREKKGPSLLFHRDRSKERWLSEVERQMRKKWVKMIIETRVKM